jgi:hypothetical protein
VALRRIKRTRRGFDVRLPTDERDVLRTLPEQMRSLLGEGDRDDPVMKRLYPSAYMDDVGAADEFDSATRDDLTQQRLDALEGFERTLDAKTLTEDELVGWLGVLNDARLVLGVRLAVTEETVPTDFQGDETAMASYALYAFLSYLVEEIVDALSGAPLRGADLR